MIDNFPNLKLDRITSDQLFEEWCKWRDSASEVKDRIVSEQFALYIATLIQKVSQSPCFRGYSQELKEDMAVDGYIKVVKNLKNMKPEFKSKYFSYIVMAIHTAFRTYLAVHYKFINLKNDLAERSKATLKRFVAGSLPQEPPKDE